MYRAGSYTHDGNDCNGDDKALTSTGPKVFSVLVLCFLKSLH